MFLRTFVLTYIVTWGYLFPNRKSEFRVFVKIENEVGYKYTSKAGFPTSIAKTQQSIARSKLSNFYGIPNSYFIH